MILVALLLVAGCGPAGAEEEAAPDPVPAGVSLSDERQMVDEQAREAEEAARVARYVDVVTWNSTVLWNNTVLWNDTVAWNEAAAAYEAQVAAAEAARAERERERQEPVPAAPSARSGRCGGDLPSCDVMECESGGDPTAQNPNSSASGKWQIIDSTWNGYGGYPTAASAPEHVQDAKARELYAGGAGRGHWVC